MEVFCPGINSAASTLKSACPDSKGVARLRAAMKGALRRSPADAMESVSAFLSALTENDRSALLSDSVPARARLEILAAASGGTPFLAPLGIDKIVARISDRHAESLCSALAGAARAALAETAAGPVRVHRMWSSVITDILGKEVQVPEATGERLDAILDIASETAKTFVSSSFDSACDEDLDGLVLDGPEASPAPDPDTSDTSSDSSLDALIRVLVEQLPADLDVRGLVEGMPEVLRNESCRPILGALHKISRRVDPNVLSSFVTKLTLQLDVSGGIRGLCASVAAVDTAAFAREAQIITRSVQQSEVIDALRGAVSAANPDILKKAILAATNGGAVSRESAASIAKKIVQSNAFPGMAAQIPEIFRKDGTIDVDRLVALITKRTRTPRPPRLSLR